MSSHTPGPWRTAPQRGKTEIGGFVLVYPDDHPPVAYVASHGDASLIAAAPELLQLAERIAEYFENTDAPLGDFARFCLAKVEGRA